MGINQMFISGGQVPLTVGVDVTLLSGYCNNGELSADPCSVGPMFATGIVSGGYGPHVYLWQNVSGDTATLSDPTSISTGFSRSSNTPASLSGVYRLRVTDNVGTIAFSPNVTIDTTHENLL